MPSQHPPARRSQPVALLLPLLCGLVLILGCCSSSRAAPVGDQLPSKSLLLLAATLKQEAKPSVELVFDAYEDYVRLHQLQAAGSITGAGGQPLALTEQEQEATRAQIGAILGDPLVRVASDNLFSLLPDDNTDGKFTKTARLRRALSRAINNMGLS